MHINDSNATERLGEKTDHGSMRFGHIRDNVHAVRPGFSIGTLPWLRNVNSLSFFISGIVFSTPMSTFCLFSNDFGEPKLCMLSIYYHWHV